MNGWIGRPLGELTREARRALGIDDRVRAVHDASFPPDRGEGAGRGTPYSGGARRLGEFAAALWASSGCSFGPQGVRRCERDWGAARAGARLADELDTPARLGKRARAEFRT